MFCYPCHIQKISFHSSPFHPLAFTFFIFPLQQCFLSLSIGDRYNASFAFWLEYSVIYLISVLGPCMHISHDWSCPLKIKVSVRQYFYLYFSFFSSFQFLNFGSYIWTAEICKCLVIAITLSFHQIKLNKYSNDSKHHTIHYQLMSLNHFFYSLLLPRRVLVILNTRYLYRHTTTYWKPEFPFFTFLDAFLTPSLVCTVINPQISI